MRAWIIGVVAAFALVVPMAQPALASDVVGGPDIYSYSHNGGTYQVSIALILTSKFGLNYVSTRFVFDGLLNTGPGANKIEVYNVTVWESGSQVDEADQTNDRNQYPADASFDGGGADIGNYSLSGPCDGFRDIQNHNMAFGADGCLGLAPGDGAPSHTNFSQTDKYHDPAFSQQYVGYATFRIKWNDGAVGPWRTLQVSGSQ